MKFCIIDTIGLCFDGITVDKRGLGGSESAVIYMARELTKLGHEVIVYNDCDSPKDGVFPGNYSGVEYKPLSEFNDGPYDITIAMRTVAPFVPDYLWPQLKNSHNFPDFTLLNSKYKVVWMHDTFLDGDHLLEESLNRGFIDEIITLSDFHTNYILNAEHGKRRNFEVLKRKVFQSRNGSGIFPKEGIARDPNLFVYNSSVTKGLIPLLEMWPDIKRNIPEAKLKIIGGYYRFRAGSNPDEQEVKLHELLTSHDGKDGVSFTGVIPQSEISEILSSSSMLLYPAEFPETFGISSLEALVHNVPIVTCDFGALEETAIDIACYKIPYAISPNGLFPNISPEYQRDQFVKLVVDAYYNPYLLMQKRNACNIVKEFATWESVARQWEYHYTKILGKFLPVDKYRKVKYIDQNVSRIFGRRFDTEMKGFEKLGQEKLITIITPVYNGAEYIKTCIDSVVTQDYDNWEMFIIDDASEDDTADTAYIYVKEKYPDLASKFIITRNIENVGALQNQIDTLSFQIDKGIVMLLDGDDYLVNDPTIFNYYNRLYSETPTKFSYGSCWSMADQIPLIAQEYPEEVKKNKTYREHLFPWNIPYTHLRTFDYSVFHDYLLENGVGAFEGIRAGGDAVLFYELIETLEPEQITAVPHIIVNYNDLNPNNDYKVNGEEQTRNANAAVNKNKVVDKKKILIAIPTAKYIEPITFKSIYDLEVPEGYEVDFQYFFGYNLAQIRNLVASWAVNYDYLFSVDSDISFSPDTLNRLLEADADIISGIYRQRLPEQAIEIYGESFRYNIDDIYDTGIIDIYACGFGCVLIKSEVFKTIPYPQFEYHNALNHADTVSEDYDFCRKANLHRFKVKCDTTLLCGHHGDFNYEVKVNPKKTRLEKLNEMDLLPQGHYDLINSIKYHIPEVKNIWDIGSSALHWHDVAKEEFPDAEIICFEAMEEFRDLYIKRGVKGFVGTLLSDVPYKSVPFYQNTEHPGGNSIYRENKEYSENADILFPENKYIEKLTNTLDNLSLSNNIPVPDVIKLDTQGSELEILKGYNKLHEVKAIIIEIAHVEYNLGSPKFSDVTDFLNNMGFILHSNANLDNIDSDYLFFNESILQ